jgi:hypothetical protein
MFGARELVGALLLSVVAVASCGSSSPPSGTTEIAAKNYARDCATVADCFAVYEGPVNCCGGGCPNAAIRADALPKYMSDVTTALHCGVALACPLGIILCQTGRVGCVAGVCAFEAPDGGATN